MWLCVYLRSLCRLSQVGLYLRHISGLSAGCNHPLNMTGCQVWCRERLTRRFLPAFFHLRVLFSHRAAYRRHNGRLTRHGTAIERAARVAQGGASSRIGDASSLHWGVVSVNGKPANVESFRIVSAVVLAAVLFGGFRGLKM